MNVVHENILVDPLETVKVKNGILLPESSQVDEKEGFVLKAGESVPDSIRSLLGSGKVKIKYKEYYDGNEVTVEKKKYIVMKYTDILLIL